MSFWNSLYLNLKEFRYLFLFGFIVFVFNIFLEYVGGKIKCRKRKIKCRIFATNYLSFNLKLKL